MTRDSLIRVRMMKKGNYVYCRFSVPNTDETLQTMITLEQYNSLQYMNLSPISIPAVWKDELDELFELKRLNRNLEVSNASSTASYRD